MTPSHPTANGCGSTSCQCVDAASPPPVAINGMTLDTTPPGHHPESLQERAYGELLRQRAVALGLLPPHGGLTAPDLTPDMHGVIEGMLEREVATPEPTESECLRHYAANARRYTVGQALRVRHILFGVTPGVNVQALSQRAEQALLELTHRDAPPNRFEQLAAELSNCPTGPAGGDLGWLSPTDCAPELARALFDPSEPLRGVGLHPRLMHSRYGFHIIEVLDRREGVTPGYDEVAGAIRHQLAMQCRATALRQYMQMRVGEAQIDGLDLEGVSTPLVQ